MLKVLERVLRKASRAPINKPWQITKSKLRSEPWRVLTRMSWVSLCCRKILPKETKIKLKNNSRLILQRSSMLNQNKYSINLLDLNKIKNLIRKWTLKMGKEAKSNDQLISFFLHRRRIARGISLQQQLAKLMVGEKRTWALSLVLHTVYRTRRQNQTVLQNWNSQTSTHLKKKTKHKKRIKNKLNTVITKKMKNRYTRWKRKQSCNLLLIYSQVTITLQNKGIKLVPRTRRWKWWENRWWIKKN